MSYSSEVEMCVHTKIQLSFESNTTFKIEQRRALHASDLVVCQQLAQLKHTSIQSESLHRAHST